MRRVVEKYLANSEFISSGPTRTVTVVSMRELEGVFLFLGPLGVAMRVEFVVLVLELAICLVGARGLCS